MLDGFVATNANFKVNSGQIGGNATPAITALGDGRFIVVWTEYNPALGDTSLNGISGQILDASGTRIGGSFRINSQTVGDQSMPAVTTLGNGGFVVTWEGGGTIKGQVFDALGAMIGSEFTASTPTDYIQKDPAVAALENGGFVITWTDKAILMGSYQPTDRIYIQRFDAAGNKAGDAFMAGYQGAAQIHSAVTGLADGSFIVSWEDDGNMVRAQIYNAAGEAQFLLPFRVDQNGESFRLGKEITPAITTLANGNFVVTWTDQTYSSYWNWPWDEVRGQVFDPTGKAIYSQFQLNTTYEGQQSAPSVTALDDGGFVAVWNNWPRYGHGQIVIQQFNGSGAKVGTETFLDYDADNDSIQPVVTTTENGGFVVSWQEYVREDYGISDVEIRATVFTPEGSESLTGTAGNDVLNGLIGSDTLWGLDGHDTLNGGDGNDWLHGGAGSDSLNGGTGNDVLHGGARWDTLMGGEGNDVLDGGADNDQMYGGAGNDTYVVDHVGDRVYEIAVEGKDTVRASIDYSLTANVEKLYLTGMALAGTGNGLSNHIEGTSGNNTLSGGLGNDSLFGWDGNDSLVGGNDHDRLSGGNGADTLNGGSGNDVLGGGAGADKFIFGGVAVNGHDHVVDFEHGVDALMFSGADYGFAAGHVLTDAQFTTGTAAVGSGAQFVWDSAAGKLWWDGDGTGAGAAFEIALISGGVTVTKTDLLFS